MARTIRNYDVFISSPMDVAIERDVVQEAIAQINQIKSPKEGVQLNPIRWEKDVSSQFGASPQEIINEQIGDEYDIFVGILCSRFGTATDRYESGTEEEFFRAYERHMNSEAPPEIMFFFKDPRASESPLDVSQLTKVQSFKDKIQKMGVYEEFESSDGFKTQVIAALMRALERLAEKAPSEGLTLSVEKLNISTSSMPSGASIVQVSEFDEDIGIIDLVETVLDSIEVFTDNLETMSLATGKLGERMQIKTAELKNLKPTGDTRKDQKTTKNIIEKIAAEMHRYCQVLDQSIPDAKREFLSALRCMEHAVIISNQDGMSSENEVNGLVDELVKIQTVLCTVQAQASGFRDSVSGLPRMTSKLNQAKRRTVNSLNDFLKFLSESSTSTEVTLDSIKR